MFLESDVIFRISSEHLYAFLVVLLDSCPEAVDEPLLPNMQLLPDVPDSLKSIEKQLQSEKKCIESGILVLIGLIPHLPGEGLQISTKMQLHLFHLVTAGTNLDITAAVRQGTHGPEAYRYYRPYRAPDQA